MTRVLVTGAGGFIGHHLVTRLKSEGCWVRGVDLKAPEFSPVDADEFEILDLRRWDNCLQATRGVEAVYALAADMGGMGFISANHADILHNNLLISTHTLDSARVNGVKRYFYSSSACVYPEGRQAETNCKALREDMAYPADPQDAYGWEKLTTEQLCAYYCDSYRIETRIARFHNIYGPYGTYTGGREKAPAAFCRKVAEAKRDGAKHIDIWGDGKQTRSFCYIDDCIDGIRKLMDSDVRVPVNIGSERMVSINGLAILVCDAADVTLEFRHIDGPMGVRGRNSDSTYARKHLDWEPAVRLEEGLATTYEWVEREVNRG